ncbi:tetracycline resistance MFS efflux pump [Sphaerisporangium melleum]|uniref:Tetracycline resistance MFS efflux pump n=2 Tax=Sphaerisporangium melleum TaxID=321316 RepID=A0A917RMP1_9ACTN|nr:tetracycline resistance MFS efflux pump [Sphaerisporangium melleum]GII68168.1 tetracycline resistance MFS efflux pump [Sphaerisporangium melleum]
MTPALWSVIAVTLLGYVGTAMPYPVFAPLFLGTDSAIARSGVLTPTMLFALLVAVYPLGTLIGSFYLGQLSDRVGRRRVIFLTLIMGVFTNALAGYAIVAENYALLFLARFLTGVCEGNVSVARAVVADLDLGAGKAVAFGYLSSAGYAGYLTGPLLGGFLSHLHFASPFFLAAALCVLAAVACRAYMPETRIRIGEAPRRGSVSFWRAPGLTASLAVQFFITFTINIYHEFFPALMVEKWNATPEQIGYATIVATATMITVSVVAMRPILRRWNTGQLYFCSMLLIGVSIALFVVPGRLLALYPVFVAFGVSLAIFNSSSNAWLSDSYAYVEQGKLMGAIASMFFLSNIAAAVLGGIIADHSIAMLMVLGGIIAITAGLAFRAARSYRGPSRSGTDQTVIE